MIGKGFTFNTEVTNGECPTCHTSTVFVSLYKNVYRCIQCGTDNEQKVNGVISYMPISIAGKKPPVLNLVKDDGS
jgi:uncharacterized protein (DUF983 family)|tara:strand:+ start:268 stop:492 length:225 start_codon:yes stop_codon:yes gene_type:complete